MFCIVFCSNKSQRDSKVPSVMGKPSIKRSALKMAKRQPRAIQPDDAAGLGYKETKRRCIIAGLRMMKAPAVPGIYAI